MLDYNKQSIHKVKFIKRNDYLYDSRKTSYNTMFLHIYIRNISNYSEYYHILYFPFNLNLTIFIVRNYHDNLHFPKNRC